MNRLFVLIILALCSCSSQAPKYPVLKADGGIVKIPVKAVSDGRAHFYSFQSSGKIINFIVRTDDAGVLHSCFDACYTCYKFKKGYRVDGQDIVCNECGTKFRLTDKEFKDVGACAPITLPGKIQGDFFVISASDLSRGERLF
jgi:uncharacterized membrane protein